MIEKHPISPPPELVQLWAKEWATVYGTSLPLKEQNQFIANRAVNWELESCIRHLDVRGHSSTVLNDLRAARRPKPPSAIEQAESLIERHEDGWVPNPAQWHVIREGLAEGRRALEALPDD